MRIPGCSSMRGCYRCALCAGPPPLQQQQPSRGVPRCAPHGSTIKQQFSGGRRGAGGVPAQLCQFSTLFRKAKQDGIMAGREVIRRAAESGCEDLGTQIRRQLQPEMMQVYSRDSRGLVVTKPTTG